jgi:hypothetical protein
MKLQTPPKQCGKGRILLELQQNITLSSIMSATEETLNGLPDNIKEDSNKWNQPGKSNQQGK